MIGAHQPQNLSRARWLIVFRWLAALAVFAILFHFLPVGPLRAALARVPPIRFGIILFFYLCAHTIGIFKWRMIVNAAGSRLDVPTSAQCYLGGLFGTLFLPSIIGGDVIRMAVGLRRSPRPAAVLAGNVVDRCLDVTAQATLVFLGLILLPGSLPAQFAALARRVLLIAAFVAIALLILIATLRKPLLSGRSRRFRRRLARFRYAFQAVRQRPQVVIFGWTLGVLIQGSFIVLNALLAISCGLFLPLRVWIFAWPLAKVAALLPLTQGGMGIREAALVALLLPFGATSALTLASGLIWEGVIIAGGLISGLAAFALRRTIKEA
ncbi:MAG TPA: lysylphosphatidylglycerol synthase transmembrane domain-containing protein, partial [Candidatus Acidoferrum sp.]|nr:lysylphosphatidylglycerol synthase transmembrane domain-containing protein [Candidatus Acidoferrum sp.]